VDINLNGATSDWPYDRRSIYPTRQDALESVVAQEARINDVTEWLFAHGAPRPAKVSIVCNDFPGDPPSHWCTTELDLHGTDDDKKPVQMRLRLYYVLRNPDIGLMDIARALGSDDPTEEQRHHRKLSKQIRYERWIEPEPIRPPQPVPRPFGPHIDPHDADCMLSNSTDQFIVGALWTQPDETLWQKEKAYWGFVPYHRWRPRSTVNAPSSS